MFEEGRDEGNKFLSAPLNPGIPHLPGPWGHPGMSPKTSHQLAKPWHPGGPLSFCPSFPTLRFLQGSHIYLDTSSWQSLMLAHVCSCGPLSTMPPFLQKPSRIPGRVHGPIFCGVETS